MFSSISLIMGIGSKDAVILILALAVIFLGYTLYVSPAQAAECPSCPSAPECPDEGLEEPSTIPTIDVSTLDQEEAEPTGIIEIRVDDAPLSASAVLFILSTKSIYLILADEEATAESVLFMYTDSDENDGFSAFIDTTSVPNGIYFLSYAISSTDVVFGEGGDIIDVKENQILVNN